MSARGQPAACLLVTSHLVAYPAAAATAARLVPVRRPPSSLIALTLCAPLPRSEEDIGDIQREIAALRECASPHITRYYGSAVVPGTRCVPTAPAPPPAPSALGDLSSLGAAPCAHRRVQAAGAPQ